MNLSVTAHWHLIPRGSRKKALQALAQIDPRYVRVSSLQKECLNPGAVRELLGMGFKVLPVINTEKAGCLTESQWADYVRQAARALPPQKSPYVCQVGNEWNTGRFWGCQPETNKALRYFRVGVDILRSAHDCIIVTPGVTNETKNGTGKMKARDFLAAFLNAPADFWALHYYQTEKKYERNFTDNCKWLATQGRTPVVTETGGDLQWYNRIASDGFENVPPGLVAWYCLQGHPGFDLLDGRLKGNDVYEAMREDIG